MNEKRGYLKEKILNLESLDISNNSTFIFIKETKGIVGIRKH